MRLLDRVARCHASLAYYRDEVADVDQRRIVHASLAAVARDAPLLLAFFLLLSAKDATRSIQISWAAINRKRRTRSYAARQSGSLAHTSFARQRIARHGAVQQRRYQLKVVDLMSSRIIIYVLLLSLWRTAQAASPAAAMDADKAFADATSALQNQDYRGAVNLLEPAMSALQQRAAAWRSLGLAHLKLHESSAAQEAYSKALKLEPDSPLPLIPLGVAAAQSGQTEEAFTWFRKAKTSRRVDMTQLVIEPDLQALRSDPRFPELLPTPEDFAHPFVEDVNIVREWDGEAPGDQFGWIARVIGDVDGDGANDFVTSAPTKNVGGENAGRIYVYSGRGGTLLWKADGAPGDQLGTGIEAAGDTDGDGIPDVVAGAPSIDTAYVYSGRDGRVLLTLHGEAKGDSFGDHVASVGDIDGDGHPDIVVGAPANNALGKGAGRAYIYSGKDGGRLLTLSGEHAGDAFGSTVAGYTNGKHRLLIVGAASGGPENKGRVYVYRDLSGHPAFVIDADPTGVALGYMFVSVLGDVDGDGVPDIFASDWSDSSKGPRTGKTYVYSGRTGRRIYVLTGETAGEGFGTTQSIAGDVNGDGRADLIVGSWQYSVAAQSGGRAYLYDGKSGRLLRTYTCRIPGDTFGFDAVGMGSIDSAGQAELLITSGWSGVHGYHSGRIFLISSGVPRARPLGGARTRATPQRDPRSTHRPT